WVMGYGLWVMGYGLWVMGYGGDCQPDDAGNLPDEFNEVCKKVWNARSEGFSLHLHYHLTPCNEK
ncbi:MAG TPA: hypothetical protein PLR60_01740, partial [Syntrophorhabdaceae bacterium]|nr:hypothetical protein [Syntrophorhabdaceae bacterium]